MAKITPRKPKSPGDREEVVVRTKSRPSAKAGMKWWKAGTQDLRAQEMLATVVFLKENQQHRHRQAGIYSRLYSNMPLYSAIGSTTARMAAINSLPADRPTMNVVQSCVDTLVSRITQSRPRPIFLTDNGDYKQRNLAKQLNQFVVGELYSTKSYQQGELILRDAAVLGSGCLKVYRTSGDKVGVERVLITELFVDPSDAMWGDPRTIYQLKLVDRGVLQDMFPNKNMVIEKSEQAYPDGSSDSSKSVSDLVMVVEAWRLPSGPEATDGMHMIATTAGSLVEEKYEKPGFPFIFLHYSPRILGFFGQPLTEQLMGTQMEINKLLITISNAINLVGVPRVFVEDGSKVVKAHLNNQVGSIITYQGTKPTYEVAPCIPAEVYSQLQRLVDYAYQQSGISALAASSKKPEGLNSGVAIREFDDLQSDRFASLNKRYDNMFVDLAYLITDTAKDIAEDTGSYSTVYPNKDGTREVDLPGAKLLEDTYIIQCFDASALPRDPAGRLAKITEMIQAGMISIPEGRRLLNYPDLEQNEKLANSSEERILKILDEIVEEGKYTPPDPFMNLPLAVELSNQYYNLYVGANLEEEKAQQIRDFNTQTQALMQAAQQPSPNPAGSPAVQAPPEPMQPSPMVSNVPGVPGQ